MRKFSPAAPHFLRGFTLLEIMIAMAILSVSLVTLYSSVGNSLKASGMAERTEKSNFLARQKLSEILLSIEQDIARGAFPDEKEENGTFEKPFEDYKWSYTVRKVQLPVLQLPAEMMEGTGAPSPESIAAATGGSGGDGVVGMAANSMAQVVTKKISEAIREIQVTITWGEGGEGDEEKMVVTTHIANLK